MADWWFVYALTLITLAGMVLTVEALNSSPLKLAVPFTAVICLALSEIALTAIFFSAKPVTLPVLRLLDRFVTFTGYGLIIVVFLFLIVNILIVIRGPSQKRFRRRSTRLY